MNSLSEDLLLSCFTFMKSNERKHCKLVCTIFWKVINNFRHRRCLNICAPSKFDNWKRFKFKSEFIWMCQRLQKVKLTYVDTDDVYVDREQLISKIRDWMNNSRKQHSFFQGSFIHKNCSDFWKWNNCWLLLWYFFDTSISSS